MICIVNLWSEKQRVSSKETVESVLRYTCNTPVVETTVCISGCVCVSVVLSMNVYLGMVVERQWLMLPVG